MSLLSPGSERKQEIASEQNHVALLLQEGFLEVMGLKASLVTETKLEGRLAWLEGGLARASLLSSSTLTPGS